MSQDRKPSPVARRKSALHRVPAEASPVAQCVLGALFVAAVVVLSLPQARAASAGFGWVPFWLLALPASAWLALQARCWLAPATQVPATAASLRRRVLAPAPRRRAGSGARPGREASAA
jgi:hypothetical protein